MTLRKPLVRDISAELCNYNFSERFYNEVIENVTIVKHVIFSSISLRDFNAKFL